MKRSVFIALLCAPLLAPFVRKEELEKMSVFVKTDKGHVVAPVYGAVIENITVYDRALTQAEVKALLRPIKYKFEGGTNV